MDRLVEIDWCGRCGGQQDAYDRSRAIDSIKTRVKDHSKCKPCRAYSIVGGIMKTVISEARDNLTEQELAKIILFVRHNMFLPENKKILELKEMIMKAMFGEFSEL